MNGRENRLQLDIKFPTAQPVNPPHSIKPIDREFVESIQNQIHHCIAHRIPSNNSQKINCDSIQLRDWILILHALYCYLLLCWISFVWYFFYTTIGVFFCPHVRRVLTRVTRCAHAAAGTVTYLLNSLAANDVVLESASRLESSKRERVDLCFVGENESVESGQRDR